MSIERKPALILVDPLLKDFAHHHFNYDKAIVEGARGRGMRTRLLVDRAANAEVVRELHAEPVLRALPHEPIRSKLLNTLRIGPAFQFVYAVIFRLVDLRRHLGHAANRGTMVFVPTCDARNLAAWIIWSAFQRSSSSPMVFLMLRFPCARKEGEPLSGAIRAGYALSLKMLPWLDPSERIKLCTDSGLLARQYGELTNRQIAILPIPHTEGPGATQISDQQTRETTASVVVALGDVRREKGFDILADAILDAAATSLGEELVFRLHCPVHGSHLDMQRHVDRLGAAGLRNVQLISRFLSAGEYYELLDCADVVIMPYRQESYTSRTSGPLIEAMAAGKIVIVTEGTWLSETVAGYGAGLTFRDCDGKSLSLAIMAAHRDRVALRRSALQAAKTVRAEHNPGSFLDRLACLAAPSRTEPPSD